MASLVAVFNVFFDYSKDMEKALKINEQMLKKMDRAGKKTDKVLKRVEKAVKNINKPTKLQSPPDTSINAAGAGDSSESPKSSILGAAVGKLFNLDMLKAGMDISDQYNTSMAGLDMVNDGSQTPAQLQDKVYAAANRSKGSYLGMADTVSKLGMVGGSAFKSNDEMIGFAELAQKSFGMGGLSGEEQSSATMQLAQSMGSGGLQEDGFSSIMNNAPAIADAISKYTGKSTDELSQMASEGGIAADVVKNAMFAAGSEINDKFEAMPVTFANIWSKIQNGGLKAFGPVLEKINGLVNSAGFTQFVNKMIAGFDLAGQAASWLFDTITNGWDTIGPVLAVAGGALLLGMITSLWAMVPPLIAQAAAWLAAYWPLLLIIAVIAIVISAVRQFGATWEQIFGVIGGVIGVFATYFYNIFVGIWNVVAAFINFFGNAFTNLGASAKALFYDLFANLLGCFGTMAQGIQDVINKIPGVEVDITGGLDNLKKNLRNASSEVKSEAGLVEYVKTKEFKDYSEGYSKGNSIGKSVYNSIDGALGSLTDNLTGAGPLNYDKYDPGNPVKVEGTGSGGNVGVDMAEEDLQYMRDLAEREYINKFSSATLAPNVSFTFGDVRETADVNQIAGRIKRILQEEIAMTSEGVY